jgi:hypothetical protein
VPYAIDVTGWLGIQPRHPRDVSAFLNCLASYWVCHDFLPDGKLQHGGDKHC